MSLDLVKPKRLALMKLSHLFFLLVSSIVVLSSCSKSLAEPPEIIEEELEKPKTAVELSVVTMTLEEINIELHSNGIEVFTEARLEQSRQFRSNKSCLNAKFKGDLTNDELISVEDILLIYQLIDEYDNPSKYPKSANGDNKLEVKKEYLGKDPTFWQVVHVAELVAYDEGGVAGAFLDNDDVAVLVDLISAYCG